MSIILYMFSAKVMIMEFEKGKVIIDKVINKLDRLVLDFVEVLARDGVRYVIVSGYVAILFGRSRVTEDVDILIPKLDYGEFKRLYSDLVAARFWCLNSGDAERLFDDYLSKGTAIRFAYVEKAVPNIEIKFAKGPVDENALRNPMTVELKGAGVLLVSPIEQQIAYKRVVLGSDKDIEDARHLEKLFEGHIDKNRLKEYEKLFRHDI